MALDVPASEVLEKALRSKHDETFEKALGRAIRDLGGTYADYVELISRVRERAQASKVDLRAAARTLAGH
ncbi:MAG TPA: hypothetical protein VIB49_09085 [Thermoplasmata archaeon]